MKSLILIITILFCIVIQSQSRNLPNDSDNYCVIDTNSVNYESCIAGLTNNQTYGTIYFYDNVTLPSPISISTNTFNLLIVGVYGESFVKAPNGFLNFSSTDQSNVTIDGLVITGGYNSSIQSTCIFISGVSSSTFNIQNSNISNFYINYHDGAAIRSDVPVNINNSSIFNNYARQGGAVFSTDSVIAINSLFSGNSAISFGGAIYSEWISLINCVVENNLASAYGGGIAATTGVNINSSVFYHNRVLGSGGAIYIGDSATYSVIDSSVFEYNTASLSGGHIATNPISFNITNSILSFGVAGYGGGIQQYVSFNSGIYNLQNTTFSFNNATRGTGSDIYWSSGYPTEIIGGIFISESMINQAPSFPEFFTMSKLVLVNSSNSCLARPSLQLDNIIYCLNVTGFCVNGYATIDENGQVNSCNCFPEYFGSICNSTQSTSSGDNTGNGGSLTTTTTSGFSTTSTGSGSGTVTSNGDSGYSGNTGDTGNSGSWSTTNRKITSTGTSANSASGGSGSTNSASASASGGDATTNTGNSASGYSSSASGGSGSANSAFAYSGNSNSASASASSSGGSSSSTTDMSTAGPQPTRHHTGWVTGDNTDSTTDVSTAGPQPTRHHTGWVTGDITDSSTDVSTAGPQPTRHHTGWVSGNVYSAENATDTPKPTPTPSNSTSSDSYGTEWNPPKWAKSAGILIFVISFVTLCYSIIVGALRN